MKISQKARILQMLKDAHGGIVTCKAFADNYLYHHASQRIGELKREGHNIEYVPSETSNPMDAGYRLAEESSLSRVLPLQAPPPVFEMDDSGQIKFA